MKFWSNNNNHLTLRQIFNRRLLLLLTSFALIMSGIVVQGYQHETDRLNRVAMTSILTHLADRLENQQRIWEESADQTFRVTTWFGLFYLDEPQRSEKLHAYFTAQAESMGFSGFVICDTRTGKPVFDFWRGIEQPDFQSALLDAQPFWFDPANETLYTKTRKSLNGRGRHLTVYFFKAWDNATLKHLSFANSTSLLSLGNQPLLSSDGPLALNELPPAEQAYRKLFIRGKSYHEGRIVWKKLQYLNGLQVPIYLNIRTPESTAFPLSVVLAVSLGIILLFGILLFTFFGHWLRQLGSRLDGLANAALRFQSEPLDGISTETRQLLDTVSSKHNDQISIVAQELSSLMLSAAQRDEEQRAYLQTLTLLQDAVIEFTPDGRFLRATDAWKNMTGIDDISSHGFEDCVHSEDLANLMEQLSALVHNQKQQINIRFRMCRANDSKAHYWVEARFAPVKRKNEVISIRGVVRDITNTYLQERQISHMALHDALTDLPNRVLLEDRMEMAISRAGRNGLRVALGFIDLDHFKQVNDNFGHKTGDMMLKEAASRLTTILRGTDTLSRWGGDEFVVLCPDLKTLEDARDITLKLSSLTSSSILLEDTEFPFNFSAGFAVYPDDANNGEMLLAQADRAMFYAKAQGRNNIQFFNKIAGKEPGRQSFYIQSRLNQAVHGDEIQCWLQPLISARTGKVIGAEALARWHEPEQGWIPPSVFIPMAESMGLIDKLGQSVWQQALHALTLLPAGHRLSINLSKRQLFSSTIVQQFCDDLARANIATGQIMLEITESIALSDVSYARERIAELDARGFGIAVDDFGVGYSSLSQLHEMPVDELKLDLSFVRRIHDKAGFSMATAIVTIAKSLDLSCVAEGVEDEKTANILRRMDVEVLQGYLFAKPMPISDYLDWLTARGEG